MKDVNKSGNFFKVNRSILEWEWFDDARTLQVWMYLLANAAYTEKKWRGIDIGVGDVITSRVKIAAACNMSEQNVRTCLNHLVSTGEITIKTTNHYSKIRIENYAEFQGIKEESKPKHEGVDTPEPTSNQPATNQQPTSNISKKEKKEKNDDDFEPSPSRAREDAKMKLQLENDIERLRSLAKKHRVNEGVIADMVEQFYGWYSCCREDAKNYAYLCTAFDNWLDEEFGRRSADKEEPEDAKPDNTAAGEPGSKKQPPSKKFTKPTVEEVEAEIQRLGYSETVDAVTFWNFYESKGWKVGSQPMKKWKSCLATWHQREKKQKQENLNRQRNGQTSNLPATNSKPADNTIGWQCATVKTGVEKAEERRQRKLAALDAEGGFIAFEEIQHQRIS